MAETKWYVVHTYSGYENKVKRDIENTVANDTEKKMALAKAEREDQSDADTDTFTGYENITTLADQIKEVFVPTEEVTEIKNGAKKVTTRKILPGYVLVNMEMNDETWYVVRNTRGVTGFVGPGSKPVPLSDNEMKSLGIYNGGKNSNISIDFAEGDTVLVVAGVWKSNDKDVTGVVQKLDMNKQTATILMDVFGRETPVDISFAELRKMG